MRTIIYQKLKQLETNGHYPFHMPGHKRNCQDEFSNTIPFSLDITEITGYDDLHHPEGMIREAMDDFKKIYKTKESYFLINGSTAGNLAAMASVCSFGDKILIARNCHKSVYHGVELLGLDPVYVYPKINEDGMCEGITKDQISRVLREEKGIKAAVIVSPTYEGVVSDIKEIADMLHSQGILLIVDEAHGAHFPFYEGFPKSAVFQGADLVIQSLHKTLPSLTQTGLLHLCTDRIQKEWVQSRLSIFQTSSPSYLLMASIDYCVHRCQEEKESFQQYEKLMNSFYGKLEALRHLKRIKTDDFGKVVISVRDSSINGMELFRLLRDQYDIEPEMAEIHYLIAMTSVCDTREGILKLEHALLDIDGRLQGIRKENHMEMKMAEVPKIMLPSEAVKQRKGKISLEQSEGKISGDYIYLYPPGIPLIVPGEKITGRVLDKIEEYLHNHMRIEGCENRKISIINERI